MPQSVTITLADDAVAIVTAALAAHDPVHVPTGADTVEGWVQERVDLAVAQAGAALNQIALAEVGQLFAVADTATKAAVRTALQGKGLPRVDAGAEIAS